MNKGKVHLLVARVLNESGAYIHENIPVLVSGKLSVRDEKAPQIMVDKLEPLDHLGKPVTAIAEAPVPKQEQKLYVKIPSESAPIWAKIKILFSMFPGESGGVIVFADTRRRLGTNCLIHPALVSQLKEWLGEENVVVK